MWIMLLKKLPTLPSPPKLSIFWSEEWVNYEYVKRQTESQLSHNSMLFYNSALAEDYYDMPTGSKQKIMQYLCTSLPKKKKLTIDTIKSKDFNEDELEFIKRYENRLTFVSPQGEGMEHNERTARSILYKGEKIRLYADEYSEVTDANMQLYVFGDNSEPSHVLVPEEVVAKENSIFSAINLTPEVSDLRDALMLDGCTKEQALMVLLGYDILSKDTNVPSKFPAVGWYRCVPEYASIFCSEAEMQE